VHPDFKKWLWKDEYQTHHQHHIHTSGNASVTYILLYGEALAIVLLELSLFSLGPNSLMFGRDVLGDGVFAVVNSSLRYYYGSSYKVFGLKGYLFCELAVTRTNSK